MILASKKNVKRKQNHLKKKFAKIEKTINNIVYKTKNS
jgi:hypothetical protein